MLPKINRELVTNSYHQKTRRKACMYYISFRIQDTGKASKLTVSNKISLQVLSKVGEGKYLTGFKIVWCMSFLCILGIN